MDKPGIRLIRVWHRAWLAVPAVKVKLRWKDLVMATDVYQFAERQIECMTRWGLAFGFAQALSWIRRRNLERRNNKICSADIASSLTDISEMITNWHRDAVLRRRANTWQQPTCTLYLRRVGSHATRDRAVSSGNLRFRHPELEPPQRASWPLFTHAGTLQDVAECMNDIKGRPARLHGPIVMSFSSLPSFVQKEKKPSDHTEADMIWTRKIPTPGVQM
ncbi:hypothetical protein F5141DRAFT_1063196 [Pisolithus sp. B1]|nr:hypothetical protein F5141DRAFT_1063196 [Pisolithus sp. B1]